MALALHSIISQTYYKIFSLGKILPMSIPTSDERLSQNDQKWGDEDKYFTPHCYFSTSCEWCIMHSELGVEGRRGGGVHPGLKWTEMK